MAVTQKPSEARGQKAEPSAHPSPASSTTTTRKPWVKKTPVEVVLEQIGKQEEKVAELRKELAGQERELAKLQQARKVLEAQ